MEEYLQTVQDKNREQQRRILIKIEVFYPEFLYLNDLDMKNLLINDLKLDKFSSMTIILSTLNQFFNYGCDHRYIHFNIFESAFLSRRALSRYMIDNIVLIDKKILEEVFQEEKYNREYVKAANLLCYENVCATWKEVASVKITEVDFSNQSIRDVKVSEELISLIESVNKKTVWEYYGGERTAPLIKESITDIWGTRPREKMSDVIDTQNVWRFIKSNCILYYNSYKLDAQKLYCSGVVNKVIEEYGVDFLYNNFSQNNGYSNVNQIIKRYNLHTTAKILKKKLMPYGFKVKYPEEQI